MSAAPPPHTNEQLWLRQPDVYRRLRHPSSGPAAAPPANGAYVAPRPVQVGEFEAAAADAVARLAAAADAACAAMTTLGGAEEAAGGSSGSGGGGALDVSDLWIEALPNPADELTYAAAVDAAAAAAAAGGGAAADQQGGGGGGGGGDSPRHSRPPSRPASSRSRTPQPLVAGAAAARGRTPEGHTFKAAAAMREAERAAAARLLHSVREADAADEMVRLDPAPQPRGGGRDEDAPAPGGTPGDNVVVTIAVCEARRDHKHLLAQLQLLGSCTLADLRDAIRCPTDALVASARVAAPSSYFYIPPRFYVDGRPAGAVDVGAAVAAFCAEAGVTAPLHLRPVQQAAADGGGGEDASSAAAGGGAAAIAPGPSLRMEDTRLIDIVPGLTVANRPTYLFCHAGCCEHGLFVTDVRARHGRDVPPGPGAYPYAVRRAPSSSRWRCGVCSSGAAEWVVSGHIAAPADPCPLCARCRDLMVTPEQVQGGGVKLYSLV